MPRLADRRNQREPLRRTLQGLAWRKKKALKKQPMGKDVDDTDVFVFNPDFTDLRTKVHVSSIQENRYPFRDSERLDSGHCSATMTDRGDARPTGRTLERTDSEEMLQKFVGCGPPSVMLVPTVASANAGEADGECFVGRECPALATILDCK
jgi:hypothetical protein